MASAWATRSGTNSPGYSTGNESDNHLCSKLVSEIATSAFDKRSFVPEGVLDKLITRDSVREELGRNLEEEFDKRLADRLKRPDCKGLRGPAMAEKFEQIEAAENVERQKAEAENRRLVDEFIFRERPAGARKLFAILICSALAAGKLRKALEDFSQSNTGDLDLPISTGAFAKKPWWDTNTIRNFAERQWEFLAPVFSTENRVLSLKSGHILPIVWMDEKNAKSGSFGRVCEVEIHKAHQGADPGKTVDGRKVNAALKIITREYKESEWDREVETHVNMSRTSHHHIVEFIAAITRGSDRFLLFRWADGGNLREFWRGCPRPVLNARLVRDVVEQLQGLVDGLTNFHAFGGGSYRHGDLKPENIVRVRTKRDGDGGVDVGTLKISDLGLAKLHAIATEFRPIATSTPYTTFRYEPPEVFTSGDSLRPGPGRSRRYDIWSMGCVTLEFIVWLLYGDDELKSFNSRIVGELRGENAHFFVLDSSADKAKVHPEVVKAMEAMKRDQECRANTAIARLLSVVEEKLLVVRLGSAPTFYEKTGPVTVTDADGAVASMSEAGAMPKGTRATALEFRDALINIIRQGEENSRFWCTGLSRDRITGMMLPGDDRPGNDLLTVDYRSKLSLPSRGKDVSGSGGLLAADSSGRPNQNSQLNKNWVFPVDNKFANKVLAAVGEKSLLPKSNHATRLCGKCRNLTFLDYSFRIQDTLDDLEDSRRACDFCQLRWEVSKDVDQVKFPTLHFRREDSTIRLNESYPPLLSIYRSPETRTPLDDRIQVGFPELPDIASQTHFEILRQWIKHCDEGHRSCQPSRNREPYRPPTRLLDLGSKASPTLRLYETRPNESLPYVALSHPWGPGPYFCTFTSTVEEFKRSISFEDLPSTFRDAVTTTRELGVRFLWIDSLCIIQGPGGDFDQEAKRMEDVFSAAYCVIAANSAKGQTDGFLKDRGERQKVLTFQQEDKPTFYVRRVVDDFEKHVLESPLNKRGWVLQERALARRTIYFSEEQSYWECGDGVRCETLTKMDNKLASFLGDPQFPSKLSSDTTDRGERIKLYEDLYRQYSRLGLTRTSDRPIAIAGLERRLRYDLRARGDFGIFDDGRSFLQRSLLWQRGREVPRLTRIDFEIPGRRTTTVPSWSWMAYEEGIDYLELPLGNPPVVWLTSECHGPWAAAEGADGVARNTEQSRVSTELQATARRLRRGEYNIQGPEGPDEFHIVYDVPDPTKTEGEELMCVVMGRRNEAGKAVGDLTHYVLLVKPNASSSMPGGKAFERVGVGKMLGKFIELDRDKKIRIR